MKWQEVIGQNSAKELLRSMVDNNRAPHALLLLGNEGVGTLPLALAYVQYLICENRIENDACGTCKACTKAAKYVHPDVHYSYPTVGTNKIATDFIQEWRTALLQNPYLSNNQWLSQISGGENKQGNITKEECVSIVKKLSLKPFESPFKILVMWLPEYLGKEGNRLLKLVEEPPENTIFVLIAENQEAILNTILSRCQLVKLPPLQKDDIVDSLINRKALAPEQAEAIAQLADGNFSEALVLAQYNENDNALLFLEWMRKCYQGNGVDMIQWAEKIATTSREAQKYFLRYGLHFFRELLQFKLMPTVAIRLQNKELQTAHKMSEVIQIEQIEPITTLFSEAIVAIERNGNGKLIFADISIRLNKILRYHIF
jgi:DNA polymerase III subunit delta'